MRVKTPKDIVAGLDQVIVGQEDAKRALAVAIRNRWLRQEMSEGGGYWFPLRHLLFVGSTGVGKTALVEQAARQLELPFLRVDASRFMTRNTNQSVAETLIDTFVQLHAAQLERDSTSVPDPAFYNVAISDIEQNGIVLIDDVDRMIPTDSGSDVSGEAVQRGLLSLLDGTETVTEFGPVRSHDVLFVASGSFSTTRPADLLPEFSARFPIRVELDDLTEEDLKIVLSGTEASLVARYVALFAQEGVELGFTEDGLTQIATVAAERNHRYEDIGARRLISVLEEILEDLAFNAPETAGSSITIDADFVSSVIGDDPADTDLTRFIL
jgi:ATP-dependent protease HslVU (ClpYQ) ATPase subunit